MVGVSACQLKHFVSDETREVVGDVDGAGGSRFGALKILEDLVGAVQLAVEGRIAVILCLACNLLPCLLQSGAFLGRHFETRVMVAGGFMTLLLLDGVDGGERKKGL
jgi:hypothetical protein